MFSELTHTAGSEDETIHAMQNHRTWLDREFSSQYSPDTEHAKTGSSRVSAARRGYQYINSRMVEKRK